MSSVDKPLIDLAGKSIIEYVIANANGQVYAMLISANRNIQHYAKYGYPIVHDSTAGFAGPLAGILSAMDWCCEKSADSRFVACFPGDVPWFPENVVTLLAHGICTDNAEVAWLSSDGQLQPLFSLWSVTLRDDLRQALGDGIYSPMEFIRSRKHKLLSVNDNPVGYFDNLNSPADLARAQALLTSR